MIKKEKIYCYLLLLLFVGILIITMIINVNTVDTTIRKSLDEIDLTSNIPKENNYFIEFTDDGVTCSDSILIEEERITITEGGTYVLSGITNNYQIYIAASKQTVFLIFNGVSITSPQGPAIIIEDAKKTILHLQSDTNNYLSDSNISYEYSNGSETIQTSGCIYSRDNITINGTGSLSITAQFENGIDCCDSLYLVDAHIIIDAVNNGIEVNDGLEIFNVNLQINSGNDGIKASSESEKMGYISIFSGEINISSFGDGMSTTSTLGIEEGVLIIQTGINNTNTQQDSGKGLKTEETLIINAGTITINSKDDSIHSDQHIIIAGGILTLTSGKNGIKSENEILIQKGIIEIDSSADALNADNEITIQNGELTITTKDDGIKATNSITITGGTVIIGKSYEGLESLNVTIKGGKTEITASDDGININCAEEMGGFRQETNQSTSSSGLLKVSGGYLYVNSGGDGLDSNDRILITGGTIIVYGPTNSGNGALDYGSECKVTGGILIVAGSSGMSENISSSSTQCGVLVNFTSAYNSNKLICILDSNNKVIAAFKPEKSFQSIVISSPNLHLFRSYDIYIGGTITGEEENGYFTNATYNLDGSLYKTYKQSQKVISIGESSMMGGRK